MPAHNAPAAETFNGTGLTILIIHARWNTAVITSLVDGAKKSLLACGVQARNIYVESVPGSYELPRAVAVAASPSSLDSLTFERPSFDAIIPIGCLIKGETMHFEYIASAVSHGLMDVQLQFDRNRLERPAVIFGLLTCLSEEQARARAGLTEGTSNAGEEWGRAAVEVAVKERRWRLGEYKR